MLPRRSNTQQQQQRQQQRQQQQQQRRQQQQQRRRRRRRRQQQQQQQQHAPATDTPAPTVTICFGCKTECATNTTGRLEAGVLQRATTCGLVHHTKDPVCVGGGDVGGTHEKRACARAPQFKVQCAGCAKTQDDATHPEQCEVCNDFFYLLEDVTRLVTLVHQQAPDDERSRHLLSQLDDTKDCLYRWRGHLVRHFQQTQAKLHILRNLGPTDVLLTADWSAVRTGQKNKTPQKDGYAQVRAVV